MKSGLEKTPTLEEWLVEQTPSGGVIGCDGWCTRFDSYKSMSKFFSRRNRKLKIVENPLDKGNFFDKIIKKNCKKLRSVDRSTTASGQSARNYGRGQCWKTMAG